MVMGELPENVDIAVVGGGVGGYVAAIRAAELGMSVALVEKEKLGGHCLNYACIPSKTLIHISNILEEIKDSEKFGIRAGNVTVDAKKMYDWRMSVSKKLEDGVAFLCKAHKIDVFKAAATFMDSNTLQLTDGVTLSFKKAIIATGSTPIELKGFEFNDHIIDYKKALMLDYIPESMAIIGAGYVAVEIGTLYAKLGTKVDIVARSDVLSRFDRDAISLVKKRMTSLGIAVHSNASPVSYSDKKITLEDGSTINADIVVVAIGLRPYTDNLGIEKTSAKLNEKGFVVVDKRLATDDKNIFAVGDVIGEPMLAHKAIRQGVIAAEAAYGMPTEYDNIVVPSVIFSDPEIAMAGSIVEREGITVTKFPLSALGRGIALDKTNGFVKIASNHDGLIEGIEIVAPDANAMIAEAALAIEMGAYLDDIANTIHPHPTFSEAVQEAAEAALGRPVHFFYGK
ncbi:MAG: dihydrolipoyl dehydrogenase [Candidatus Marsarchaeota archaeon]|nr:dihydrolipoyl dehydrogenase [Candidatus Marsarchaeota archaeon]